MRIGGQKQLETVAVLSPTFDWTRHTRLVDTTDHTVNNRNITHTI